MSRIAIHDSGIYKDIITGEVLGRNPHMFLGVGDKYIDHNSVECIITEKKILPDGSLMVTQQDNDTPMPEPQIINLANQQYESIPPEVQKKITVWDKVKGWFK